MSITMSVSIRSLQWESQWALEWVFNEIITMRASMSIRMSVSMRALEWESLWDHYNKSLNDH